MRVVLDIESIKRYRVFELPDPNRIVIDVVGDSAPSPAELTIEGVLGSPDAAASPPDDGRRPRPDVSLAAQLALTIQRIVIDPGHGGKDPGAIGKKGAYEKDVVLAISLILAKILRDRGNRAGARGRGNAGILSGGCRLRWRWFGRSDGV